MKLKTLKFRIKDSNTSKHLERYAHSVNMVWNYCNEVTGKQLAINGRFLSAYDLHKLLSGVSKELGISSDTVNKVASQYVKSRMQQKKNKLAWRSKKSLGWVPFNRDIGFIAAGKFRYYGKVFRYWQTVEGVKPIRCGSFNQDSRGRWYVNFIVEDKENLICKTGIIVGVDLGVKTIATYSDGSQFVGIKPTSRYEVRLAKARRAKKKRLVSSIHSKIKNVRRDALHKETYRVVKSYDKIYIGDVSSTKLAKTKLSKSVYDAGWGLYRSLLVYKAIRLGKEVVSVKENHSTVTCSNCLQRTGPSGLSGLSIREWQCSNCGHTHDRDVNAAINILRIGQDAPKGELMKELGHQSCQSQTSDGIHFPPHPNHNH